jgi:nucleotide-binding universal stress UspA family protein
MEQIRRIVVGVADAGADPQLEYAVRLAEAVGAALHVVHGYHVPDPVLYPHIELSVVGPGAIEDIQRRVQGLLEGQVAKLTQSDTVTCRAVPAPAALALLSAATDTEADLIVVGATRRGTLTRALLGTTAQRVVRGSAVPVLVHRSDALNIERVLLTTDLSELSARVHERGAGIAMVLAGDRQPVLRSLLVAGSDVPPAAALDESTFQDEGSNRLEAFLDDVGGKRRPEARVRVGDPAREIAAEATEWQADLLVLGSHGRTGASRLLIGSVAESVLRSAGCDILIVPAASVPGTVKAARAVDLASAD